MDLSKLSINELRHAIWINSLGSVPVGGLPVEEYRKELIRRGESPKGYHDS